jgi:hypothetical protein
MTGGKMLDRLLLPNLKKIKQDLSAVLGADDILKVDSEKRMHIINAESLTRALIDSIESDWYKEGDRLEAEEGKKLFREGALK